MANDLVTLDDIAAEIRATYTDLLDTATQKALRIGQLLRRVKERIPHGGFGDWLAANVPFSLSAAKRYMQLTRVNNPNSSNLGFLADSAGKTKAKKEAREAREAELGIKQVALPDKKYGVIYGDPPWRFEPYSRETGMDRAADNHYPTIALSEMLVNNLSAGEPIPIAADDCALFLWATVPMLPQAIQLMADLGFDYRSHCIWAKDRVGTGYWFRNKHELLLIGIHGSIPAPAMGTQWPSLIEAPVSAHSAKPECFLEMIEAYFPTLPKIELFRRGPPRPGWDAWGNEAEAAE